MNFYLLVDIIKRNLPEEQFAAITKIAMGLGAALFIVTFVFLTVSGATRFSGRALTLLDPTYATKYIPIIASVSEH